jgi:hypothetical protein
MQAVLSAPVPLVSRRNLEPWGGAERRLERTLDIHSIEVLVREARALLDTYLDGVGLFAWQPSPAGDGYVSVTLPEGERLTVLDDVLYRIESFIEGAVDEHGNPPPPVQPDDQAVDPSKLSGT